MELATAALIVGIVSVAAAAAGTAVSIKAQSDAADAAEKTGKFNAAVESNNALAASQAAAFDARQIRRRNLLRLGSQRAIAGKSGVDLTAGGSIDDVIFDSAVQGEIEAQSAEYAGKVRASGYQARGALSLFEGQNAAANKGLLIAGTAVSGIGQTASAASSAYNQYNKVKKPAASTG